MALAGLLGEGVSEEEREREGERYTNYKTGTRDFEQQHRSFITMRSAPAPAPQSEKAANESWMLTVGVVLLYKASICLRVANGTDRF